MAGTPALMRGSVLIASIRGKACTYPGIPPCKNDQHIYAEAFPRRADVPDDDCSRQHHVCELELDWNRPQHTNAVVRVDLRDGVRDHVRELDDVIHPAEKKLQCQLAVLSNAVVGTYTAKLGCITTYGQLEKVTDGSHWRLAVRPMEIRKY